MQRITLQGKAVSVQISISGKSKFSKDLINSARYGHNVSYSPCAGRNDHFVHHADTKNCLASQGDTPPKGRRGVRPRNNTRRIHGQHKRVEKRLQIHRSKESDGELQIPRDRRYCSPASICFRISHLQYAIGYELLHYK